MDEELIKKFLEQVRKDKFDVNEIVKFDNNLTRKKVFFDDNVKADSLDSDDEFLNAFENFAELICPKVDSGELKCKNMNKPVKKKKLKVPCKENVQFERKKELINSEHSYIPERKYIYDEKRISISESLKTMRELRIRDEELKNQYGKS